MSIQSYIEEQVRESKYLNKPTKDWLMEYSSSATIYSHLKRFRDFLEWQDISDLDLVKQYNEAEDKQRWLKDMGNLVIAYYHHLVKEGYSSNTARSATSSVRGFFNSQIAPVRVRRRAIPRSRRATGEHRFTQAELKKMFYVADVRDKAILATAVALGYGAKDFLSLPREEIKALVTKAIEENTPTISFEFSRSKTGITAYSILTPEAITSLKAWFDISNKDSQWVWHNHTYTNHITGQALNDIIKKLVEKANITTTGKVKFHLLRKFLMSSAVEANFNAFEVKFLIGKQIPVSDATYLISLAKSIQEKYPQLYERIRLTGYANNNHTKIEELEAKVQQQETVIKGFIDTMTKYMKSEISKEDTIKAIDKIKPMTLEEYRERQKALKEWKESKEGKEWRKIRKEEDKEIEEIMSKGHPEMIDAIVEYEQQKKQKAKKQEDNNTENSE